MNALAPDQPSPAAPKVPATPTEPAPAAAAAALPPTGPMPHAARLGLHDPATVRQRCAAITAAVAERRSGWFRLERGQLAEAAALVTAALCRRGPDPNSDPISDPSAAPASDTHTPWSAERCWAPLQAGGGLARARLDAALARVDAPARAYAQLDFAFLAVLLGGAPGVSWRWRERPAPDGGGAALPTTALPAAGVSREQLQAALDQAASAAPTPPPAARGDRPAETGDAGLLSACLNAFLAGAFSTHPQQPCRVDADALLQTDAAVLRGVFQASTANPLAGLDARAALLGRLGQALQQEAQRTGLPARPGLLLLQRLRTAGTADACRAQTLLREVLALLAPVWAGVPRLMGASAGDIWPHRFAGGAAPATRGWVPLHAPAQALCLALRAPLQAAGCRLDAVDELSAVADLDSAGLLLDTGVLQPRSALALERVWKPGDEFIVEWRALTVTLLDELATRVRAAPELASRAPPSLAQLQYAGVRPAAQTLAAQRRGGLPALRIETDGTIL